MDSKKQNNTRRHRKMMNRLRKRQVEDKEITLPELPKEIVVEILTKIPPEYLCKSVRYVCKDWYRLISSSNFIHKNAMYHKPGVLTQAPKYHSTSKTSFLQHTEDENQLGFNLTNFSSRMGTIRSSCNGLILVIQPKQFSCKRGDYNLLCVKNSLTNPTLTLPKSPSGCKHDPLGDCGLALGFDPVAKLYKVVHVDVRSHEFEVLTIDYHSEWRRIPGPFKGPYDIPFDVNDFWWGDAVSINGRVFHWRVDSEHYIISMDVSNETVSKTKLPDIGETINTQLYELVDMDGKLGFVYSASEFIIDVWVLSDFGRQIWSKQHSIIAENTKFTTMEDKKDRLPHFTNLGAMATLRNGEVMMMCHVKKYCHHDSVYLYDFKSKEMKKLKMKMKAERNFIPHRSSLVSWETEMYHPGADLRGCWALRGSVFVSR